MKSVFAKLSLVTGAFALSLALPAAADEAQAADDGDLVPIEIELPEAFFGGTPDSHWSPVLEPKDFRPRPPFLAPAGTTNVALEKTVTASVDPLHGQLSQITDGDKDYVKSSLVEFPAGTQWVQVDLEKEHNIYAILVWHFHEGERVYFDVIVQASNDPEFKEGVTTLYNNDYDNTSGLGVGEDAEYHETNEGRLIDAEGVAARYVRLYSNGNSANDLNHYVEVEVYGIPA
jgi:hypothetical protein